MSLAARDRVTVDDFLAMDELPPGSQLVDGELVVCVPAFRHGDVVVRIVTSYVLFSQGDLRHGRMGWSSLVRAGEHDGYVPDFWWVPASTTLPPDGRVFPEAPALVVEVRSPSTWHLDRGRKLGRYEALGVAEVWLVDGTDDVVTVHQRSAGSNTFDEVRTLGLTDTLTTRLVPGWTIDLAELFRR